jgi:translation elongation factor EF-G
VAREASVKIVAETDEVLPGKFFKAGALNTKRTHRRPEEGTIERKVFPMALASALLNIDVQALLDGILAPSPTEHPHQDYKCQN